MLRHDGGSERPPQCAVLDGCVDAVRNRLRPGIAEYAPRSKRARSELGPPAVPHHDPSAGQLLGHRLGNIWRARERLPRLLATPHHVVVGAEAEREVTMVNRGRYAVLYRGEDCRADRQSSISAVA